MQSASLAQALQCASQHIERGDIQHAVYVAEQVLEQCPDFAPLLWLKAYCWETLAVPLDQRLAFAEQALQLAPEHIELNRLKGDLLRQDQRQAESISWLEDALQRLGGQWQLHLSIALSLLEVGDAEQAAAQLRLALKRNKHCAAAWFNLVDLVEFSRQDLTAMQASYKKKNLALRDRAQLCFAIAAYWRAQGQAETESRFLHEGNRALAQEQPFSIEQDSALVAQHIATVNRESLDKLAAPQADTGPRAIFIVGMPRCGSTLLEQMLGCHGDVTSTGESCQLEISLGQTDARRSLQPLRPSMLPALDDRSQAQFLQHYQKSIAAISTPVYTDKSLDNHRVIGLVHALLPGSKIINVHRDPLDVILSCYQRAFWGVPYTNDLLALTEYYINYRKMLDHWRSLYDTAYYELRYEALVERAEEEQRLLCDYCELEWEPAMLAFDRSTATVQTTSRSQVRQGLYTHSVKRWRPYRKLLQPVIARLREAGLL